MTEAGERSAYEWGQSRKPRPSCKKALDWRRSLGNATQREAWLACDRGDWLIWQLWYGITEEEELADVLPRLRPAIDTIVDRAVRKHCLSCGVAAVESWTEVYLSGNDRSEASASKAAVVLVEKAVDMESPGAFLAAISATKSAVESSRGAEAQTAKVSIAYAEDAVVSAARSWANSSAWAYGSWGAGEAVRTEEYLDQAKDIRAAIPTWDWDV